MEPEMQWFHATAVIKVMHSNAALAGITGKTQLKRHRSFSEDAWLFSQIHLCKNTRAAFQCRNVPCSVYITKYNPSGNLFVAVSFDIVMGATNKSMNGNHWTLL